MQTQASPLPATWTRFLPRVGSLLFYSAVAWIVLTSELPAVKPGVFFLKNQFLAGNPEVFKPQDPGLPFAAFNAYRPQNGRVSFLADFPFDSKSMSSEQFQAARGELAPLVLNALPGEKIAFFYCSNTPIAEERAKVEGYRLIKILGDGKGIAEKIS